MPRSVPTCFAASDGQMDLSGPRARGERQDGGFEV
jgi:hypothetical protein